jgi:hypothetical protein
MNLKTNKMSQIEITHWDEWVKILWIDPDEIGYVDPYTNVTQSVMIKGLSYDIPSKIGLIEPGSLTYIRDMMVRVLENPNMEKLKYCYQCGENHEMMAFCTNCGECLFENSKQIPDKTYPLFECLNCNQVNFWD